MTYRRSVLVLSLITLGGVSAGCVPFGDPEGPGARGVVSLGEGVSTSELKTLQVRAIPASELPFDDESPQFTRPDLAADDRWHALSEPLDGLSFPHPYEIGDVVGTTDHKRWRLLAWLSAGEDAQADGPESGEPYGTTTFDIDSCGRHGGYCTVTDGVNVTVDRIAP
ncbi:hypothetical protein WMF31_11165 [Sorangium sp. So ce1036]|uniref:hypothetical protein n=1 Tax=Sorangium sp. So ce1036 TaxID=3133328 RepID=UPI003F04C706